MRNFSFPIVLFENAFDIRTDWRQILAEGHLRRLLNCDKNEFDNY